MRHRHHIDLFWSGEDVRRIAEVPDLPCCSADDPIVEAASAELETAIGAWLAVQSDDQSGAGPTVMANLVWRPESAVCEASRPVRAHSTLSVWELSRCNAKIGLAIKITRRQSSLRESAGTDMQAIFLGSVALTVGAALPVAADDFFSDLQRLMQQGKAATRDAQPFLNAIGKAVGGGQQKQPPPENSEVAGLKKPPEPAKAPPSETTTLSGKDLKELQTLLVILAPVQGFTAPSADGKFGPKTQRAIEGFQAKNGLPVDGKATPEVLQAAADVLRSVGSAGTAVAAGDPPAARAATKERTGGARPALAGVAKTPDG